MVAINWSYLLHWGKTVNAAKVLVYGMVSVPKVIRKSADLKHKLVVPSANGQKQCLRLYLQPKEASATRCCYWVLFLMHIISSRVSLCA